MRPALRYRCGRPAAAPAVARWLLLLCESDSQEFALELPAATVSILGLRW